MQAQTATNLAQNKRLAKECLDMIFNQKNPAQAVAQYIGPSYRQHNPDAADGPQGVIAYAGAYIKANPDLHVEFKRIIAEGDYVAVHSHLKPHPGSRGEAIVDIFRVEDGKLVEHWDVVEEVPEPHANRNTMF
ncbi:MAG: ester cyclase [Candidatus Bathyarchaeota archaeon]|nr:ester cyclase [Candidatus Bathyarchaeota archaeon]